MTDTTDQYADVLMTAFESENDIPNTVLTVTHETVKTLLYSLIWLKWMVNQESCTVSYG